MSLKNQNKRNFYGKFGQRINFYIGLAKKIGLNKSKFRQNRPKTGFWKNTYSKGGRKVEFPQIVKFTI